MITSFRHRGLALLFLRNEGRRIRPDLVPRCRVRLSALENSEILSDLNLPGFNFHRLQGRPQRFSIHVSGPWCITFEWETGQAVRFDLEQYH
ncbi:MAG: type II toxin-antitoxin system RelE/ParE family toxin [SAR324 cluster bacterium]|nr:type II toxin-antitoxin system RelE/ParE family toxin [SAR324 cluster bacterium]